ncbi:TIR domain-containing protein, partial [bacterium]|nr:TIR domain-containing protein [bacterium]
MADIFLSYKKIDRERVEGLARDLTDEGFTVWWDYAIESGDDWFQRIIEEVRLARCLVGCWTRNSVDARGMFVPSAGDGNNYVRVEHETAGRARIAGAMMDEGSVPAVYRDMQYSNLVGWAPGARDHSGFRDLVERAERLATPAFMQRSLAALEQKRAEALEQLAAARTRGDGLQLELNRVTRAAAQAAEAFETERRAFEQERLATGAVLARQQQLVKGAEAQAAEAARLKAELAKVEAEHEAEADGLLAKLESAEALAEEMKVERRRLGKLLAEAKAAAASASSKESARAKKQPEKAAGIVFLMALVLGVGALGGWLLKPAPLVMAQEAAPPPMELASAVEAAGEGAGAAPAVEAAAPAVEPPSPPPSGPSAAELSRLVSSGAAAHRSKDYDAALRDWTAACDQGHPMGCGNLGVLYKNGQGVAQDFGRARELYQRACDGGEVAGGCFNLGLMYANGQGVAQDFSRARALYQKA